jgi:hypothetical protein
MQVNLEEELHMKVRIARLGVLLAAVVGLVASSAAPAGATGAGVVVVQGNATVGAGIAYPCIDPASGVPPISVPKCLPPQLGNPNSATFAFVGTGAGVIVNGPNKGAKTGTVEAGTFTVTANGTVSGACGLSVGVIATGTVTPIIPVGTKTKNRTYVGGFIGVGGVLVIQGTTNKAEVIVGAVLAVPIPGQGSCTDKGPKVFLIAGAVAVVNV